MEEIKKPSHKRLAMFFILAGLFGFLLSIVLAAGTILLLIHNLKPTLLSLLGLVFMMLCSVLALGVGIIIFKYGEFP